MRPVLALVELELKRFLADRFNLFFVFVLPLVLVGVLGLQSGGELWLIDLAENKEVDSVVLFGTLKEKPAKLPPEVAAHWIQDGLLKNDQAIEEAA